MPRIKNSLFFKTILLLCSFFIITSCANSNGSWGLAGNSAGAGGSDLSRVNPQNNSLYLQGYQQPVLEVSSDFRYGGAEIVPSPKQQAKRHLFPGPASSFVAITVLQGSMGDIRQEVGDTSPKDWEFVVQQTQGPEWIKVTGNTTPCCTNLLHSRYLFVPFKQDGHASLREIGGNAQNAQGQLGASATLEDGEQGYILIVSYAEPLPENLPADTWQGKGLFGNAENATSASTGNTANSASTANTGSRANGASGEFGLAEQDASLTGLENSGLTFDNDHMPGLYNQQLGLEQRQFLQKSASKARQAYKIK